MNVYLGIDGTVRDFDGRKVGTVIADHVIGDTRPMNGGPLTLRNIRVHTIDGRLWQGTVALRNLGAPVHLRPAA